eukprot:1177069-Prorocentrum_minimum.AAC.2
MSGPSSTENVYLSLMTVPAGCLFFQDGSDCGSEPSTPVASAPSSPVTKSGRLVEEDASTPPQTPPPSRLSHLRHDHNLHNTP